jgi:hypothetical protein
VRNVERGEGSIPSKKAARFILDRWVGESTENKALEAEPRFYQPNTEVTLERELRRYLERRNEVGVSHPIRPWPAIDIHDQEINTESDRAGAGRQGSSLDTLHKQLRRRLLQTAHSPDNQGDRN